MTIGRASFFWSAVSAVALAGTTLAISPAAAQDPPEAAAEQGQEAAQDSQAEAEEQQQREAAKAQAEAEKQQQREAAKAKAAAEAAKAKAEAEKQQQREAAEAKAAAEAAKAQAEAEKQQQHEAAKAQAEAEREAAKAQAEAEKQQQREAAKAKAEAEREAAKAQAEAEKQQQREAAEAKAAAEAAKAQAEAEKQQLEAAKSKADKAEAQKQEKADKADAEKHKQKEAEKAKGQEQQQIEDEAKAGKAAKSDADKGTAEADKQKQSEAEKAKADAAAKSDADKGTAEADKAKAAADKQQPPQSDADRANLSGSRDGARLPQLRLDSKDEKQAAEQLKQERVRTDDEFEKAKRQAQQKPGPATTAQGGPQDQERRSGQAEDKFVKLRKQRQERVVDGRAVIEEPDKRVIIIDKDRSFVRHDETKRFGQTGKAHKRERRKDGTILSIFLGFGGVEIINLEDEEGHLLRRSRRGADGREIVLVDNRRFYGSRPRRGHVDAYVDLPPPIVRIPRRKYIVDDDDASEEDIYEALNAPPIERLQRGYALEEVRQSRWLRERMRRVDLNAINFAFASWEVDESQYPKLERLAYAMKRILKRNPDEMFLIEGHTDAVGSHIDNLSLSDRRAESVAIILSDTFRVPPENLTTQGYGEQYLKVLTEGPSRVNRRVAARRITPLLSRAY